MKDHSKIAIFYGGFQFVVGGVNSHARTLTDNLNSNGHHAATYALDDLPFLLKYCPHITEKFINLFFFPLGFIYKGKITKILFKFFFGKRKFDYIIFEDIYLSWNSSIPSITILHAVWSDNLQAFKTTSKQLNKLKKQEIKIIESIKHPVATVSQPYLDFLLYDHFRGKVNKGIFEIPLGIDQKNLINISIERDPNSIIYTGALEARKNVLFLLEVFNLLYKANNSYKLTIIGDGPDRALVEDFISKLNLPVKLLGRIEHDEVIKELQKHNFYLHTSTKESFSYALLEAKLCGLKTFAHKDLQVPSEFIDVKIENFEIKSWFNEIIKGQNLSKNINFEKYSIERMSATILKSCK